MYFFAIWVDFGRILELERALVVWGIVAGSSAVVQKDLVNFGFWEHVSGRVAESNNRSPHHIRDGHPCNAM